MTENAEKDATGITGLHVGRSWVSHHIEDECPCDKAPCGLAVSGHPTCPEHSFGAMRTMRQGHRAEDCPAHDCATCADCLHNGNECCGCYDGACCVLPPGGGRA